MKYLMALMLMSIVQMLSAQYISGKTHPQDGKVITDWRDDSYLYSTTITPMEMREHLSIIASDEMMGRETGEDGNNMAASYLADQFRRLRLPEIGDREGYFQTVSFTFSSWDTNEFTGDDKEYRQLWDYIGFPQESVDRILRADEIAFAGYGIVERGRMNDYEHIDRGQEVVMVYDGEPMVDDRSWLTGTTEMSEWSTSLEKKTDAAQKKGVKLLLVVSNDLQAVLNANRRLLVNRVTQLGTHTIDKAAQHTNVLIISTTMAQELLGDSRDEVIAYRESVMSRYRSPQIKMPTAISTDQKVSRDVLLSQNVLGYIEGTDLKDELVIVSAHYDHVGHKGDQVYNGADDDGSGTTAVLEIAEALVTAKVMGKGPRRSVLCLLVTGEEKGLLGSEYYSEQPLFPLESTVADVNVDMVGRWGEEYSDRATPYIYLIGSDRISQELHDITEEKNDMYTDLLLDYKYNDDKDPNRFYFRSDHYNFAKHGIPSIFYFNGVHEDYHKITDTVDKIDFELMALRTKLMFHSIWEIANRDKRLSITNPVR